MRPMKILMTLALLVLTSVFVRADDKGPVGRYQLLYAVTETTTPASSFETKRVWKIDTVTGQVWEYVATFDPKHGNKEILLACLDIGALTGGYQVSAKRNPPNGVPVDFSGRVG